MISVRAYIKGENIEAKNEHTANLLLDNGQKLSVYYDKGAAYMDFYAHAGSVIIPTEVRTQITQATIREDITDDQLCHEIKRGEYVLPGDQGNEIHATVIGDRRVHTAGFDAFEVESSVTIEVIADTPENALRLFQDILAGAIKPFRPYGSSNTGVPVDSD